MDLLISDLSVCSISCQPSCWAKECVSEISCRDGRLHFCLALFLGDSTQGHRTDISTTALR